MTVTDDGAGEGRTESHTYEYSCPWWYDLPAELVAGEHPVPDGQEGPSGPPGQLLLTNALWNRLVEIEHAHEARKAAIWVSDPGVAAVQGALSAAEAEAEVIRSHSHRRKARPGKAASADLDAVRARVTTLRAARDAARARVTTLRAARDAAREAARPGLREAFAGALRERGAAIKVLYPEFTGQGLGWGACNDVIRRRFKVAVSRVRQARVNGEPAALGFRGFDGTGTLTVQVMGGAGVPARTVPALNSGAHPRSGVMRLTPWADPALGRPRGDERLGRLQQVMEHGRYGTLRLTIGRSRIAGPLTARIPVVLDRFMPADADVREVKVTRYRIGSHYRVKVSVVCSQPATLAPGTGGTVAVRLGWQAASDGGITVAHVESARPLPPVPHEAAHVVRISQDSRQATVHYLREWRTLLRRDRRIHGDRDKNLEELRPAIITALAGDRALARSLDASTITQWRSTARFRRLADQWPASHPLAPRLAEWRRRDLHLLEYEVNETAQVLGARRDAYRCAARWLADFASALVLDGVALDEQYKAPADGQDEESADAARDGRRAMHDAAAGDLRAAITTAAMRRGTPVTMTAQASQPGKRQKGQESTLAGLVTATW